MEFSYVRKRFVVVIGVVIVLLLTDIVFVWPSPCAPAGNNNHVTNVINQNQAVQILVMAAIQEVSAAETYRLVGSYVR